MSLFRYARQNEQLFAAIEATRGVEESIGASNFILMQAGMQPRIASETRDTNFATGAITVTPPRTTKVFGELTASTILRGSGTAGTAPDYGTLLRGAGFAALTTAAAVSGTAQAVAASTITLATTASTTDGAYVGMVMRGTSGAINGQARIITAYVGSSRVATVFPAWSGTPSGTPGYSIDANVLYSIESLPSTTLTVHHYQRERTGASHIRHRFVGMMGAADIALANAEFPQVTFRLRGQLAATPDTNAGPTVTVPTTNTALPLTSALCYYGVAGASTEAQARLLLSSGQLRTSASLDNADDPFTPYGVSVGEIVRMEPGGQLQANALVESAVNARNFYADALDGRVRQFWAMWGATAGQRVSIYIPDVMMQNVDVGDLRGGTTHDGTFRCTQIFLAVF